MAISLCSALLLVTLSQAPPVAPTDSLATLRGRAAQDSSDAQLWLLMGRAYLGLGVEAHGATHRSSEDSVWTRAVLDTAEAALGLICWCAHSRRGAPTGYCGRDSWRT